MEQNGISWSREQIAEALQWACRFSAEQAVRLAAAGPEQIRSPWEVPGMEALVERLLQALRRGEPLLLFGDFDADGITGSALLFVALRACSDRVERYSPPFREGYGLHREQVERFARRGVRLILTVDTGITSHRAVERARQLGLEVLITDHHLPRRGQGPPAALVVNPPDHLLSGAQLAYLVAQAVRERVGGRREHDPWGLALSAVGAQVDWVPVDRPETRAWIAWGHRQINSPHCPAGLQVLRDLQGEAYTPSEMLSLGGVLNMAKRSHRVDPNVVVEVLLPGTALERRREVGRFLLEEGRWYRRQINQVYARTMEVVRSEVGRPGLLICSLPAQDERLAEVEGPLASRLAEATGRPTLVLHTVGEQVNFCGRARGGFSFESFLDDPEIVALMLGLGGHRQAIGGTFLRENLRPFLAAVRRWEERQGGGQGRPDDLPAPVNTLEHLDPAVAHLFGRAIGPFGHCLRPPLFRTLLQVKGGWAFAGGCLVELNRPLPDGVWEVLFSFDEARCDGQRVGLRVRQARPA